MKFEPEILGPGRGGNGLHCNVFGSPHVQRHPYCGRVVNYDAVRIHPFDFVIQVEGFLGKILQVDLDLEEVLVCLGLVNAHDVQALGQGTAHVNTLEFRKGTGVTRIFLRGLVNWIRVATKGYKSHQKQSREEAEVNGTVFDHFD